MHIEFDPGLRGNQGTFVCKWLRLQIGVFGSDLEAF